MVKNLPRRSAWFKSIHGEEESEWDLLEHLIAGLSDDVKWLAWTKTEDAAKKPPRNRPKLISRPGVVDDSKKRIGKGSLPADQMAVWLGGDFILPAS